MASADMAVSGEGQSPENHTAPLLGIPKESILRAVGITHNKSYAKFNDFCAAILGFLRDEVPKNWQKYADSVTDNFRVINPKNFRVLA